MFKFKTIFEQRQQLLRNEPEKARASSHLVMNFENRVKVREFEIVVDRLQERAYPRTR